MKELLCLTVGAAGSAIAGLFGGWDASLLTLIIFMAIDYATGLIVAGVFHNSPKTENGAIESKAGWKGLCRKCMVLLFVLVAYRLDVLLGAEYIRDAVCIGFILNEIISIVENAGLMGVPIPKVIINAIEVLKNKQGGAKIAKKIYISPSSQWENLYKTGNTNEGEQCRKIADYCGKTLTRCGFSVKTGDNKKTDMYDRAKESDSYKADIYLPIHTNASNGKTTGGTQILLYSASGERLKIAKSVFNRLAKITPGEKAEKIKAQPDFYEIYEPNATTIYCECEFHDTKEGSDFIIKNTKQIGEAIARGLCDYYGVKWVEEPKTTYTVTVSGLTKANSDKLVELLKNNKYTAKVTSVTK